MDMETRSVMKWIFSEFLKAQFLFKSKIDRDFRNFDRNEVVDLKLNLGKENQTYHLNLAFFFCVSGWALEENNLRCKIACY